MTVFVTATQKTKDEFKQSPLARSLSALANVTKFNQTEIKENVEMIDLDDFFLLVKYKNNISLPKYYNQAILSAIEEPNLTSIVFVHDDVSIEDGLLFKKLKTAFNHHQIVGLAGATEYEITKDKPALWHIMSTIGNNRKWSGAVAHKSQNGRVFMTNFGESPQKVRLLDGLFLACDLKKIKESGLKFNENNPCIAHFYDLSFCIDAEKKGLKLTTWPIWVVHESPGLEKYTEEFKNGDKWFKSEYSS